MKYLKTLKAKRIKKRRKREYTTSTSREFCRRLEPLNKNNPEMITIQDKKEKDHQKLWKKRRAIVQRSRKDKGIEVSVRTFGQMAKWSDEEITQKMKLDNHNPSSSLLLVIISILKNSKAMESRSEQCRQCKHVLSYSSCQTWKKQDKLRHDQRCLAIS